MEEMAMPRTLTDIFNENPTVEVIEVVDYDDGRPFGISADGRKLKIFDDNIFARQLAQLPGANTAAGHITDEGYYVRGGSDIISASYGAFVHRRPPDIGKV